MSQAPVGQRSAQSPQCRQTSSSFAMMRPVFSVRDVEISARMFREARQLRCRRSASSPFAVNVMQSSRADVDAGVALDAHALREHRLDVAVEAALRFLPRRVAASKPNST